jgi:hypothetical protein
MKVFETSACAFGLGLIVAGFCASPAAADVTKHGCAVVATSENFRTDYDVTPLANLRSYDCRVVAQSVTKVRHKIAKRPHGLFARAERHPSPKILPAPALLVPPTAVSVSLADNCSGNHANLLCPGYQLLGVSY